MSSRVTKRSRTDPWSFPGGFQPYMQTTGNASTIAKGGKRTRRSAFGRRGGSKLVRLIKKVINSDAEKKEILTSLNTNANATATFVILVNGTAQGVAYNQRVGLEATHAYIEVSIGIINNPNFATNTTGPYGGDFGFWALVLDRQPNGAAPIYTDIFDNSAGTAAAGTDFRITTTNQDRFKIISRNEWAVGCATGNPSSGAVIAITGAPPYHVKEYIDLSKLGGKDQKSNFSGTGATIASIDSGALFFVWASSTSDADNNTTLYGQCKYRFTDV